MAFSKEVMRLMESVKDSLTTTPQPFRNARERAVVKTSQRCRECGLKVRRPGHANGKSHLDRAGRK